MQSKKKWHKPELTVLIRGKPEETILVSCKVITAGGGPQPSGSQCMTPCWGCGPGCPAIASS